MLLKKYSYLLLAGLMSTAIVSCDDEDDTIQITDDEQPTATLTSPTAAQLAAGFEPGATVMVQGTVMDNRDLETVTLMVLAPDGTTELYKTMWDEDDFEDETLVLNESIQINAAAPNGMYKLVLTAMDDAENTLRQTWDINVMAMDAEMPTLNLVSPTADQLAAGFEQGSSFMLQGEVMDNEGLETVMVMLTAPGATEPWFTQTFGAADFTDGMLMLDETIAIPADAMEGAHVLTLNAMDAADNVLTETWDINVMPAAQQDVVTYTITIPQAVTEDIYISGEFMNADGTAATWNVPGDNAEMMLTRVDDLTYTITLPVMDATGPAGTPDDMIEYKYVLGTGWDNVEVAIADCVSSNRTMALPLTANEMNDTVEAWKLTCGR